MPIIVPRVRTRPAFSYLRAGYYDALLKVDAIPLVIPPLEDTDDLDQVLDLLDGWC